MSNFTNDNPEQVTGTISVLTYFKSLFLALIPLFGLLYSITLSFKPNVDKNQKNLARAILLIQLLLTIVLIFLFFYIWNNIVSPLLSNIDSLSLPTYTVSPSLEETFDNVKSYDSLNIFNYFNNF